MLKILTKIHQIPPQTIGDIMKDILIAIPVETKLYPTNLPQCDATECGECLAEEFKVAGHCYYKGILAQYFSKNRNKHHIQTYHLHNGNTKKYLPESHLDCNNLSCATCIMDEFRFQKNGNGEMVCTLKNMLNKYMR